MEWDGWNAVRSSSDTCTNMTAGPPFAEPEDPTRHDPIDSLRWCWRLVACVLAAGCGASGIVDAVPTPESDTRFDIEVRFWGDPPPAPQQEAIMRAARRWEHAIVGPLEDVRLNGEIGCGPGSPKHQGIVDDVVIFVRIAPVEGLAEAGPCILRTTDSLPITASIWLDGDYFAHEPTSFLETLVMHEMGHALGFGTLWRGRGLLRAAPGAGEDPSFSGTDAAVESVVVSEGVAAGERRGGASPSGGASPPGGQAPVETRSGVCLCFREPRLTLGWLSP